MQSSQEKEQGEKVFATPRTEPLKPVRVVHYYYIINTQFISIFCFACLTILLLVTVPTVKVVFSTSQGDKLNNES